MDIHAVLRQRHTALSFNGQSVDSEIINRILEAGRSAPSAKNRQTWRFIAVRNAEMKNKLHIACFRDDRILNSGYIIAACTTNIEYVLPNGQPSHILDMAFAVSHMEIQATHEGLSTAVIGSYEEQEIKNMLSVPYSMRVVLLLAVGYSDDSPRTRLRLPWNRVISFEHW